uniref:rRNA-processing protein FYV7 n=1 Tax=Acrobeloides nanus TaxID=290746 RepID=A0A914D5K4_9BILA
MNIFENSTIESDQNMVQEKKKHPGGRKKKWKSKNKYGRIENAEELSQFRKERNEYMRRYRREVKQGIRTPAKQQKRGRPRKLERTPDGRLTADAIKMEKKRRAEYMREYRKKKRTN